MSFAVSIGLVWTYLVATTSLEFLASPAMIYFLISGCMQPLMARALFTKESRASASLAPNSRLFA